MIPLPQALLGCEGTIYSALNDYMDTVTIQQLHMAGAILSRQACPFGHCTFSRIVGSLWQGNFFAHVDRVPWT